MNPAKSTRFPQCGGIYIKMTTIKGFWDWCVELGLFHLQPKKYGMEIACTLGINPPIESSLVVF
jgi:hypothetical protein